MARRRRGTPRPFPLIWLFLAVPLVALAALYVLFDANRLKPRIEAAASHSLGRAVVLHGPIRIALSLTPTLEADDVAFANPPGFGRADLATLGRAQAQLALWPLLRGRLEVGRLVLVNPDVMLETNAQGGANWHLAPAPGSSASAAVSGPAPAGDAPRFDVHSLQIEGGRVAWLDARTGMSRMADLSHLEMTETAAPEPGLSVRAALRSSGHAVTVTAELGTLAQLMSADDGRPWPLQVVLRTEGTRLAVAGTAAHPLQGRGYALTLEASAPELAAAGGLFGIALPTLRDVSASAKVSDATGAPVLSQLAAHAGPSQVALGWRHLALDRLEAATPALDQPVHVTLEGTLEAAKLRLTAELGSLQTIREGPALPFSLSLSAADATLSAQGSLASPVSLGGGAASLSLRVPDLAGMSRLAGSALPKLRDLAFDARLSQAGDETAAALVISGAKLTLPQADVAGDVKLTLTPRLGVTGELVSQSINLDALLPLLRSGDPPPAVAGAAAGAVPSGVAAAAVEPGFDLSVLSALDADLKLSVAEIRGRGLGVQAMTGHAVLAAGRLTLDPVTGTLPGGRLDGKASLTSQSPGLAASLGLSASGVPIRPLMGLLGLPEDDTGVVELSADVTASGGSAKALVASLSGRLGVAATDGELDNRLLGRVGEILRVTRLPVDLLTGAASGRTRFRCVVLRSDLVNGAGSLGPVVVDASRLLVQGAGTVNLDDQTLALRLRPMIRTGGPGIVVPVRVTGKIAQPNVSSEIAGGALEGLSLNGLVRNPLATLGNTLAGERGGDACGPAVTQARGARPGGK